LLGHDRNAIAVGSAPFSGANRRADKRRSNYGSN
jgi:hypothetical protein